MEVQLQSSKTTHLNCPQGRYTEVEHYKPDNGKYPPFPRALGYIINRPFLSLLLQREQDGLLGEEYNCDECAVGIWADQINREHAHDGSPSVHLQHDGRLSAPNCDAGQVSVTMSLTSDYEDSKFGEKIAVCWLMLQDSKFLVPFWQVLVADHHGRFANSSAPAQTAMPADTELALPDIRRAHLEWLRRHQQHSWWFGLQMYMCHKMYCYFSGDSSSAAPKSAIEAVSIALALAVQVNDDIEGHREGILGEQVTGHIIVLLRRLQETGSNIDDSRAEQLLDIALELDPEREHPDWTTAPLPAPNQVVLWQPPQHSKDEGEGDL